MQLVFGAPVAFLAPAVAYMMNWIVAWVANDVPGLASSYWPVSMFCSVNGDIKLYCGRSIGDLEHFMLIFFFAACIMGWESIRILLPDPRGPEDLSARKTFFSTFRKVVAWSIVVLPTVVLAPHIYATVQAVPAPFGYYGWGTEMLVDFLRTWIAGACAMLLYAILRRGGSTGFA